jgi:hypothetical protein
VVPGKVFASLIKLEDASGKAAGFTVKVHL